MSDILTDDDALARAGVGDVTHYMTKRVDGTHEPPLEGLEADLSIQLSPDGVEADRLVELTRRLEAVVDVDSVVYGAYGSGRETLRDVIGRLREDAPAALA